MVVTRVGEIEIRPRSSVYATYRRLSYKPWYALAEFVDNSTDSHSRFEAQLARAYQHEGPGAKFRVEITYDPAEKTLVIYDNAYGMEFEDFERALVLDSPPLRRGGRSEFGMGLKTAACWFGTRWTVESTQLGSDRMFRATVDVDDLAKNHPESIGYEQIPAATQDHFTRITLSNLQQVMRGRTLTRVREQLTSIYREDLRSGKMEIIWNLDSLCFQEPPILEELHEGNSVVWKHDVAFMVPWERGEIMLPVRGWIAIRNPGKQRDAGFVLLRRGRVILGGPDEGYKPFEVFGQGNTFRSQRLIGELHLDDWPVTQAKDGFDWADGLEDAFVEQLEDECRKYGQKAEDLRVYDVKRITPADMESASHQVKDFLSNAEFGKWVKKEIAAPAQPAIEYQPTDGDSSVHEPISPGIETASPPEGNAGDPPPDIAESETSQAASLPVHPAEEIKKVSDGPIEHTLQLDYTQWLFRLYWQGQMSDVNWMEIDYPADDEIDIYLNTAHPFFAPYLGNRGVIELLQKLIIALALAEKMARISSHDSRVDPGDFRSLMNKVLRRASELEVSNHD